MTMKEPYAFLDILSSFLNRIGLRPQLVPIYSTAVYPKQWGERSKRGLASVFFLRYDEIQMKKTRKPAKAHQEEK